MKIVTPGGEVTGVSFRSQPRLETQWADGVYVTGAPRPGKQAIARQVTQTAAIR